MAVVGATSQADPKFTFEAAGRNRNSLQHVAHEHNVDHEFAIETAKQNEYAIEDAKPEQEDDCNFTYHATSGSCLPSGHRLGDRAASSCSEP